MNNLQKIDDAMYEKLMSYGKKIKGNDDDARELVHNYLMSPSFGAVDFVNFVSCSGFIYKGMTLVANHAKKKEARSGLKQFSDAELEFLGGSYHGFEAVDVTESLMRYKHMFTELQWKIIEILMSNPTVGSLRGLCEEANIDYNSFKEIKHRILRITIPKLLSSEFNTEIIGKINELGLRPVKDYPGYFISPSMKVYSIFKSTMPKFNELAVTRQSVKTRTHKGKTYAPYYPKIESGKVRLRSKSGSMDIFTVGELHRRTFGSR